MFHVWEKVKCWCVCAGKPKVKKADLTWPGGCLPCSLQVNIIYVFQKTHSEFIGICDTSGIQDVPDKEPVWPWNLNVTHIKMK